MGKSTGIAWARSTFSPWLGCTEVSPGCDNCYARVLDQRYRYGGATHWGAGVPRHRVSQSRWDQVLMWERICALEKQTGTCAPHSGRRARQSMGVTDGWKMPGFWPVFPSLCDPFDNEVPDQWRVDLWELIHKTPNLTWLLLTKRIGNVAKMIPSAYGVGTWPWPNVWIGASIVNQEEADRDLPKLLAVPAAKRFVSYEPALEAVDFSKVLPFLGYSPEKGREDWRDGIGKGGGVDQIIVGGESKQGGNDARMFDLAWARSTLKQCREATIASPQAPVACFIKQMGGRPFERSRPLALKDRAGADPAEWPEDLRHQEFPS